LNTVNAKLAGPLLPGLPNGFYTADLWRYRAYGLDLIVVTLRQKLDAHTQTSLVPATPG